MKFADFLRGSLKSKTMGFNGAAGVAILALEALPAHSDTIAALAPAVAPYMPAVLVVGNMVLRMLTSKPLSEK